MKVLAGDIFLGLQQRHYQSEETESTTKSRPVSGRVIPVDRALTPPWCVGSWNSLYPWSRAFTSPRGMHQIPACIANTIAEGAVALDSGKRSYMFSANRGSIYPLEPDQPRGKMIRLPTRKLEGWVHECFQHVQTQVEIDFDMEMNGRSGGRLGHIAQMESRPRLEMRS